MRLKKLGAALAVVAALGAVIASSAFAAATTTDVQWYTGASPGTLLSGSATVNASAVEKLTFTTSVGGTPVVLEATGLECEGCKIENSGATAIGSGKLNFTGVSVVEPSGCKVASTITTKALSIKADYMIGTDNYILFEPTAGSTTAFAPLELESVPGKTCPLANTPITAKGTVFVKSENATGVQATTQTVSSSKSINETAGGSLHVGSENADLTGTTSFTLSSGLAFGTH